MKPTIEKKAQLDHYAQGLILTIQSSKQIKILDQPSLAVAELA